MIAFALLSIASSTRPALLHVYDASDTSRELYNSVQVDVCGLRGTNSH